MEISTDIEKMEFEDALNELEAIVKKLEEGKPTLKESVNLYERGTLLKRRCDSILAEVQLKLSQIACSKDGTVTVVDQKMEV